MSSFTCDDCGRGFKWTAAMAGKKAKCACGSVIAVPASEPDHLYDVVEEKKPKRVLPADPHKASSPAAARTVAYAAPKVGRERERDLELSFWGHPSERKVPLITLCASMAVLFGTALYEYPSVFMGGFVTVAEGIAVVTMIIGAFLTARVAGIGFGVMGLAMIKLAAVVATVDAVDSIVTLKPYVGSGLVSWGARVITFYGMMMGMFDFEFRDVFILGMVTFIVRMIAGIAIIAMMMKFA